MRKKRKITKSSVNEDIEKKYSLEIEEKKYFIEAREEKYSIEATEKKYSIGYLKYSTDEMCLEKVAKLTTHIASDVLKYVGTSKKMLGVHVSAAGGVANAIQNAVSMGCRSFALFVRNQRKWTSKPMEEDAVEAWNEAIKATGFPLDQIVPHGSYLINPGSPDIDKLQKTREAMLDECQRCERLGITMYNFHPGSSLGKSTKEECIKTIAETIDYIHSKTTFITLVVETMAGTGHTIGGSFRDLRSIIEQVTDKNRVGICIDTCHIFASGYDLRTKEAYNKTMEAFQREVNFHYLKAVHLNDSKEPLSSCKDRHSNIGKGHLGLTSFGFMMNDPRFDSIPMVLETPEGQYPEEMKELYQLQDQKLL